MEAGSTSPAAAGLVHHVESVADGLNSDALSVDCDVHEDLATAIIVLFSRVPTLVERSSALSWDETNDWALRATLDDEGDTVALAYLEEEVLPNPNTVLSFVVNAEHGRRPGLLCPSVFRSPNDDDDLEQRLADLTRGLVSLWTA